MAPSKKAAAETTEGATTEAPRRSTRIAAIPAPAVAPKPAKKASNTKKRAAEEPAENDKAEGSNKKVR